MDLTLMHREDEVLTFRLDSATCEVSDIRPLGHADLAPLGVLGGTQPSRWALEKFVSRRCLAHNRKDLSRILEALHASHPLELAVRTHGFSLSDQYWYRTGNDGTTWVGSNFFDNGWDDSFGKAVLACDYRSLAHANLLVPDLTSGGAGRKAWIHTEDGARLIKAPFDRPCELVGEVLGSRMLARLLGEGEYLPYELVRIKGTTYVSCPPMVGCGEDLLNPPSILAVPFEQPAATPHTPGDWKDAVRGWLELAGVTHPFQAIAKIGVVETLLFKNDSHSGNLGLIRDASSPAMRLAPFYDLAGAFGTFGRQLYGKHRKDRVAAALSTAAWFSNLDPAWDYSWFDPTSLDGFGSELEDMLRDSTEIPSEYPAIAHELFNMQLHYIRTVTGF